MTNKGKKTNRYTGWEADKQLSKSKQMASGPDRLNAHETIDRQKQRASQEVQARIERDWADAIEELAKKAREEDAKHKRFAEAAIKTDKAEIKRKHDMVITAADKVLTKPPAGVRLTGRGVARWITFNAKVYFAGSKPPYGLDEMARIIRKHLATKG